MLSIRGDPFPLEAACDLAGIVRALRGGAGAGGFPAELRAIAAVVGDLRQPIAPASAHPPGMLGFFGFSST